MADIRVTAEGAGSYLVEIDDSGASTTHRVVVPDDPPAEGLPDAEPERLVRESFAFLLEREPPTSILSQFSLTDISRYFPEYRQELGRRLG